MATVPYGQFAPGCNKLHLAPRVLPSSLAYLRARWPELPLREPWSGTTGPRLAPRAKEPPETRRGPPRRGSSRTTRGQTGASWWTMVLGCWRCLYGTSREGTARPAGRNRRRPGKTGSGDGAWYRASSPRRPLATQRAHLNAWDCPTHAAAPGVDGTCPTVDPGVATSTHRPPRARQVRHGCGLSGR